MAFVQKEMKKKKQTFMLLFYFPEEGLETRFTSLFKMFEVPYSQEEIMILKACATPNLRVKACPRHV